MQALRRAALAGLALLLAGTAPAQAEVTAIAHGGFASHHSAIVAADRAAVWDALVRPQEWWTHSWSGDPANLSLDPVAGGCFCEVIPVEGSWEVGSAEHARVVMAVPGRTLRLNGAFGPLQAEGLAGVLSVTLEDAPGGGTRISWDYVIGGAARSDPAQLAPVVDGVMGEFLASLVARVSPR